LSEIFEFSVVILPANEDDVVVAVVFVVVMLAANDELLFVILLESPSILNAALELLVVTVEFNEVIEELKEEDAE
jgi:hypothetical protein